MEKHCWKSEWHGAGKPMNLVNFVRMKRAEMRRDGDEGRRCALALAGLSSKTASTHLSSTVELQALYYFPVKAFLIYIYRESQRPCIQSAHHQ
jgi:hypothetical protein